MREVDIKLLWGRAADRCSVCRIKLSEDPKAVGSAFVLGEQAHIVGEKQGSARYMSSLTPEERDRYHNRILLWPNHHTEIDKNETDYPIERLYQIKTEHELWVQNTLGEGPTPQQQAEDRAYALIVDAAVEACHLKDWKNWTSRALDLNPRRPQELPDEAHSFATRAIGAALPGRHCDLERAVATLARAVHEAARYFLRHAELDERRGVWRGIQFYKHLDRWDRVDRQLLEKEWDEWIAECHSLVILATKAANWFAEEVRGSLNPFFFLEEGKFLISQGPMMDLSFSTELHEFTAEEKASMPQALIEHIRELDKNRPKLPA